MKPSAHTLMMAIKAVEEKKSSLALLIENASDPELSELEDEMQSFTKAQMELKKIYEERQKNSDNLPPYEDLLE